MILRGTSACRTVVQSTTPRSELHEIEVHDLFAGPGGWDVGLGSLGVTNVVGFELDEHACATGRAAGHKREQVDVAETDPLDYGRPRGVVASPPCQSFSAAGKGLDVPAPGTGR
jgi:site-specific DNA-cytosine methylase